MIVTLVVEIQCEIPKADVEELHLNNNLTSFEIASSGTTIKEATVLRYETVATYVDELP